GYDAIYGKEKNGMLKQWICFLDHERQNVRVNGMKFDDFLKVRYGNKNICDENSFEVWMKIKLGHTNISDSMRCVMFKEWVKEDFNFGVNIGRTKDDPYSRNFDEYKDEFDKEIEQLVNQYELKAGRKRYALEEVWKKCKKFHDSTKQWYDEGFEEEELWQNGIEEIDYTPSNEMDKEGGDT
nr:phospholipase-like protein [Tanacetum cinerariifolium]